MVQGSVYRVIHLVFTGVGLLLLALILLPCCSESPKSQETYIRTKSKEAISNTKLTSFQETSESDGNSASPNGIMLSMQTDKYGASVEEALLGADPYYKAAEKALERGEYYRAAREFNISVMLERSHEKAVSMLEKIRETQAKDYGGKAKEAVERNDYEMAIKFSLKTVAIDPIDENIWSELEKQYYKAIKQQHQGSRRREQLETRYKAWNSLKWGLRYFTTGNLSLAESKIERVVDFDSSFALAHLYLGIVLERRGASARARLEFTKALGLDKEIEIPADIGHYVWRVFCEAKDDPFPSASTASDQQNAIVFVTTSPAGAEIHLDGELHPKETPAILEIPTGEYSIEFQKPGYSSLLWTFTAQRGINTTPIDRKLSKETEKLVISSEPEGASIFIDGVPRTETTPADDIELPLGDHTIGLEMEGYEPYEKKVTIADSYPLRIEVSLSVKLEKHTEEPELPSDELQEMDYQTLFDKGCEYFDRKMYDKAIKFMWLASRAPHEDRNTGTSDPEKILKDIRAKIGDYPDDISLRVRLAVIDEFLEVINEKDISPSPGSKKAMKLYYLAYNIDRIRSENVRKALCCPVSFENAFFTDKIDTKRPPFLIQEYPFIHFYENREDRDTEQKLREIDRVLTIRIPLGDENVSEIWSAYEDRLKQLMGEEFCSQRFDVRKEHPDDWERNISAGNFDIAFGVLEAKGPDDALRMFSSDEAQGGRNIARWLDPDVDIVIDQGHIYDPYCLKVTWQHVRKLLEKDCPYGFIVILSNE